jgi:elongation factor P
MLDIKKIKVGAEIEIKKEPYRVLKAVFSKIGRQNSVLRTKLKNLKNGNIFENTLRSADKIEEADLTREKAQFLYSEKNSYFFMDQLNYNQFSLEKNVLGNLTNFLTEGCQVEIIYHNGVPINIDLPIKISFKVIESPPAIKGNTAEGASKTAKIETGYQLKVPIFIKEGDTIRINTQDGSYVKRVNTK